MLHIYDTQAWKGDGEDGGVGGDGGGGSYVGGGGGIFVKGKFILC